MEREELLELCERYVRRRQPAGGALTAEESTTPPVVEIIDGYLHAEISESEKNSLLAYVRGTDSDTDSDDPLDEFAEPVLVELDDLASKHPALAAALGGSYIIKPDIVSVREPEEDAAINIHEKLVDELSANRTILRKANGADSILHASISCKWTIRSDRSQNSRTEALNLIRNRKGHLPHIAVVTAEPMPGRIASIALGTGDVDCVYHFALPELHRAVAKVASEDSVELMDNMIRGNRLKDISDLPLDLAV